MNSLNDSYSLFPYVANMNADDNNVLQNEILYWIMVQSWASIDFVSANTRARAHTHATHTRTAGVQKRRRRKNNNENGFRLFSLPAAAPRKRDVIAFEFFYCGWKRGYNCYLFFAWAIPVSEEEILFHWIREWNGTNASEAITEEDICY